MDSYTEIRVCRLCSYVIMYGIGVIGSGVIGSGVIGSGCGKGLRD